MAIVRVQTKNGSTAGATTVTATLTSTPTNANFLIATISTNSTNDPAVLSITQTGVTWRKAKSITNVAGSITIDIWYGTGVQNAASLVTANLASSVAAEMDITEYSGGLTDVDKTASNTGSSSTYDCGTTPTTGYATELWIAAFADNVGVGSYNNPSNSFTEVGDHAVPSGPSLATEEKIVSATGAANTTVTRTAGSGAYAAAVATFFIAPPNPDPSLTQNTNEKLSKQVQVKLYDRQDVLRKTVTDVTLSSFEHSINGGLGELTLKFARPIDNFGEGSDIDFGFRVEVRVVDQETPPEGILVYQGYIQSYDQELTGTSEHIIVRCLGYQTRFALRLYKSGSNTTITHSSRDPSYVIKDAVASIADKITTSSSSVDNTGLSISYVFRNNTIKETIDKCLEYSPNLYYWFTDANNVLYFSQANFNRIDHVLQFKKHYNAISIHKTIEKMRNATYVIGGGNPNLYRRTQRTSSINEYGKYEETISDQRVTVTATADQIGTTFLDRNDHPVIMIRVKVVDSNYAGGPNLGYDIEKFRPGQIIQLANFADDKTTLWDVAQWDVDFWDFNFLGALANPFIINRIIYDFDSATLELGEPLETFPKVFRDLNNQVDTNQNLNLPAAPTDV